MSSTRSFLAQPKTKKLVVTQDTAQGEQGPHFFSQADINTWYSNNSSNINKVSETMYIVTSNDFTGVVYNLDHSLPYITQRKTFIDLGKSLYIGNSLNADLLVLQKVQVYGLSANGGLSGDVGYVVVENNSYDLNNTQGRFLVRCARI